MAHTPYTAYIFRFTLPDGPHIAVHRSIKRPRNEEEVKALHQDILVATVGQNPDCEVDFSTLRAVAEKDLEKEIAEEARKLKEENPDRPLANELGLDHTNRLLSNPDVAKVVAAANSQREGNSGI
jgi:hypothetical protein